MSISLTVQAAVVDLRADIPHVSDEFYIDTNVWYWTVYERALQRTAAPRRYQLRHYPQYVRDALRVGSRFLHLGLCLGELAHVIESAELDIFQQTRRVRHRKEFRHNFPSERADVAARITDAWQEIERMSSLVNVLVNQELVAHTLQRLQVELLDGYDALVVERLAQVGVNQVITDDADFATVAGLTVFTANLTMLNAAQAQDQLIIRET